MLFFSFSHDKRGELEVIVGNELQFDQNDAVLALAAHHLPLDLIKPLRPLSPPNHLLISCLSAAGRGHMLYTLRHASL